MGLRRFSSVYREPLSVEFSYGCLPLPLLYPNCGFRQPPCFPAGEVV